MYGLTWYQWALLIVAAYGIPLVLLLAAVKRWGDYMHPERRRDEHEWDDCPPLDDEFFRRALKGREVLPRIVGRKAWDDYQRRGKRPAVRDEHEGEAI